MDNNNAIGFLQMANGLGCGIANIEVHDHLGGQRMCVTLENGFGLSILCGGFGYTKDGTFEVGTQVNGHLSPVLENSDEDGHDGVYGYLDASQVTEMLVRGSKLDLRTLGGGNEKLLT